MTGKPPGGLRLTALFVSLYALQGVVVAYLLNFNKGYMISAGVPERTAAWVETAALSLLIFKFLLGPLSDRFSPFGWGHRKPYIALGVMLLVMGLVGLTLFHPATHLLAFGAMAVLAVAGMSLFDTTCDGFVIDVTAPLDRSNVQGLLQLSRFLATMVCTPLFGVWIARHGAGPGPSDWVILACAALGIVPLILVFTVREPPGASSNVFRWSALKILSERRSLALLAFGALYGLVGLGVEFNLNRWYDHLGYGADANGLFASIRYGGRAFGAILFVMAGRKLGMTARLVSGILVLAIATAGQATVSGDFSASFWAFLFGVANGWNDALFCVLAMGASNPLMAASTFSVYMAVSNVSIVGDALFLELAGALPGGFPAAFALSALLVLPLLAFAPTLGRAEALSEGLEGSG